ncbi:MAG: ERCC4 domain-containing protein [Nanoarchaeota archaeon]
MTKFLNIFSNNKEEKEKILIIADHREKNSLVIAELIKRGCEVKMEQLEVGDYLVKDKTIERKTWNDLQSSIIDKRIEGQLEGLKKCKSPLIIIEKGIPKAPTRVHENALRGKIISIIFNHKMPIIYTENEEETAKYLCLLGNERVERESSLRPTRNELTNKELQEFILEGFPGVGPVAAKRLLSKFKTLRNILNAREEEIRGCLGKKADKFVQVRDANYLS